MEISGKTKIVGIFGYPVKHTLSPIMHNAAFTDLEIPYVYLPFEVKPENLKEAIAAIRVLRLAGINLTVPHKIEAIRYLDEITREGELIGSINTIQNKDGKLIGHNTDGKGFVASLKEDLGFNPKDKHVLLLGASGSGRAILVELLLQGAKSIVISNRTVSRGIGLVQEFSKKFSKSTLSFTPLSDLKKKVSFSQIDLLINSTSLGMKGEEFPDLPLPSLPPASIVYDIIYSPLKTKLIEAADRLGLVTKNGLGMLLHQGSLSFQIWTQRRPSLKIMQNAIIEAINKPGEG